MSISHWYYLHTNGDLICKVDLDGIEADFRDSDFVRHFWPVDLTNRAGAWAIVVEAAALGANPTRIEQLANHWKTDDTDADNYADYLGIKITKEGTQWCATKSDFKNLQESPFGLGDSKREAITNLAKALGFRASKMWGATFADLCKVSK